MKKHASTYGSQGHYYQFFYPAVLGTKSTGLFHFLSSYPHKLMEKPFRSNVGKVLIEVGVGAGEHIPYVRGNFAEYWAIDQSQQAVNELKKSHTNINCLVANAEELPFQKNTFDRLIATCLFVHLDDPEIALSHWHDLVKDGGVISIYLPAEPGLALRLFRRLLPRRKASKMGYTGYDLFIAREHKSSLHRSLMIIREYFDSCDVKVVRRPFPFLGWYLNLFYVIHVTVRKK